MKKTHHSTIEEMLEKGKAVRLSSDENAEMKAALLSYANFHGKEKVATPAPQQAWYKSSFLKLVSAPAFALLLMASTGYAAQEALPGEVLYGVKVGVVEELVGLGKFSAIEQLEYRQELYERRLFEMHELARVTSLTEETLIEVEEEFSELAEEVRDILATNSSTIPVHNALEVSNDLVAITDAAHEVAADAGNETVFGEVNKEIETINEKGINALLSSGTTSIELYLETQLTEISEEIEENDLKSSTTVSVAAYIADGKEAIAETDYAAAVDLITDTLQIIESEEYVTDYADEVLE